MVSVQSIFSNVGSGLLDDFRKRNFLVYGQWIAILNVFLCISLGIANLFHVSVVIAFSIVCIVQGLLVIFVEIPFLLKICPLTDTFTTFVRRFDGNWPRCFFYLGMSAVQFCSIIFMATSLIAVAVLFLISSICYGLAAVLLQEYVKLSIQVAGDPNSIQGQASTHIVRNVL